MSEWNRYDHLHEPLTPTDKGKHEDDIREDRLKLYGIVKSDGKYFQQVGDEYFEIDIAQVKEYLNGNEIK